MDKILTVVIPTYNMESYLEKCLDSVLVEQVIGLIEVMIVNDGSKDSSLLKDTKIDIQVLLLL